MRQPDDIREPDGGRGAEPRVDVEAVGASESIRQPEPVHQFAAGVGGYRDHLDSGESQAPQYRTEPGYRAFQVPIGQYRSADHDLSPDL